MSPSGSSIVFALLGAVAIHPALPAQSPEADAAASPGFRTSRFPKSPSGTVSLLDFGRAGRGRDDTPVFQKALNHASSRGKTLRIPAGAGEYRIGPVRIPGNSRLVIESGVLIRANPGFKMYDRLLNIVDVSNVEITGAGAELRMNKEEYREGEWRHCLYIAGASNVRVTGLACNDSGGDGLYIGRGERGNPSRDITMENCSFANNRRQGFSLTSGSGIHILRCRFTGTRGTAPECGIDLEPNEPHDRLENVVIEDCVTAGNRGDGLMISAGNLTGVSAPVSITVRGHRSERNQRSGYFATYESGRGAGVRGSILIDKSRSEEDGEYGAVASFYSSNGPLLTFRDLTVLNANMHRKTYDNAAVAVKRGGGGVGKMGNVHFIRPKITDTKGNLEYYFTFRDYSGIGFDNVEFRDPELRGASRRAAFGLFDGRAVESVNR